MIRSNLCPGEIITTDGSNAQRFPVRVLNIKAMAQLAPTVLALSNDISKVLLPETIPSHAGANYPVFSAMASFT